MEEYEHFLSKIDWNEPKFSLHNINSNAHSLVEQFLQKYNYKCISLQDCYEFTITKQDLPDLQIQHKIEKLKMEDVSELESIPLWKKYPQGYAKLVIQHSPFTGCIRDQNGKIIACIIIHLSNGSLGGLFVKEEYRRKGLGKELIWYMSKQLLDSGRAAIAQVEVENKASISLLKKLGFKPKEGNWFYYYFEKNKIG